MERADPGSLRINDAEDETIIEGHASVWGLADRGDDIVERGAFAASLRRLMAAGRMPKLLWQHDPTQPIGVWDEVREDGHGLFVRGRIVRDVAQGREAAALVRAGAIDGLSIGYRALRATKDDRGRRRLVEVDLWEVSLVTFPMLPEARLALKGADLFQNLAREVARARETLRAA
ncbi:MAG TPA: HK97 family phage prohead protease [Rubellimicrobium sp.]|nr:HK97 family phage prohead protease [Rubellimicrobium sp.]